MAPSLPATGVVRTTPCATSGLDDGGRGRNGGRGRHRSRSPARPLLGGKPGALGVTRMPGSRCTVLGPCAGWGAERRRRARVAFRGINANLTHKLVHAVTATANLPAPCDTARGAIGKEPANHGKRTATTPCCGAPPARGGMHRRPLLATGAVRRPILGLLSTGTVLLYRPSTP